MFSRRPYTTASIVLAFLAIVCSRIPLFNYLGFEFSALTAIVAGFVTGLVAIVDRDRLRSRGANTYWIGLSSIVWRGLVVAALPGLLMMANVLFVKNCSLADGISFFLLLVFPSVVFCISLSVLLSSFINRWTKTIFSVLCALILAHIPVVTLIGPQLFAFNPIVGYFPGITYDETLPVLDRLLLFRGFTFAGAVLFLVVAAMLRDRTSTKRTAMMYLYWAIAALITPALIVAYAMSDRLGFSSSEGQIRNRLGGRYQTAQFDIVYATTAFNREQAERLAEGQGFAVDRMRKEMNLPPLERITVFLYADAEQKGKLTGAARTAFAKPWLRQVHITVVDAQAVLTHELAHVVAAEFGTTPLKIGLNPGVIEGFAVAMERRAYEEPLATAAALAFSAGVNPPMQRLFSISGFMTASPAAAYTLAGSFCRFLIDGYGSDRFRAFYSGSSVDEAYGRSLDVLTTEWRSRVDSVILDDGMKRKARYLFKRPSMFAKECMRVIAQRNVETGRLLDANRFEEALVSADHSLRLSKNTDALFQRVRALSMLRRYSEIVQSAQAAFSDSAIAHAVLPLHLRLGDAYWSLGSIDSAKREYESIREAHLSSWYDELAVSRLLAMRAGTDGSVLWSLLTRELPDTSRRALFAQSVHPLILSFMAQDLLLQKKFSEAQAILSRIGPFPQRELEYNRLRRLGRSCFELGEWERARSSFLACAAFARPGELIEIRDWLGRCDTMLDIPSMLK